MVLTVIGALVLSRGGNFYRTPWLLLSAKQVRAPLSRPRLLLEQARHQNRGNLMGRLADGTWRIERLVARVQAVLVDAGLDCCAVCMRIIILLCALVYRSAAVAYYW